MAVMIRSIKENFMNLEPGKSRNKVMDGWDRICSTLPLTFNQIRALEEENHLWESLNAHRESNGLQKILKYLLFRFSFVDWWSSLFRDSSLKQNLQALLIFCWFECRAWIQSNIGTAFSINTILIFSLCNFLTVGKFFCTPGGVTN